MQAPRRQARHTDDAATFAELISGLVDADPVGLNIIGTNVAREVAHPTPGLDAAWLWVEETAADGDPTIIAIGMHTPPFRPFVATTDVGCATLLADLVGSLGRAADGVVGTVEGCRAFARQWKRSHPCHVATEMRTGVYELRDLTMPVGVAGTSRTAGRADEAVVFGFAERFIEDIGLGHAEFEVSAMRHRLDTGRLQLWEVNREPVSMAFANPPEAGVARVGWVYTPNAHRGRGYGSAVTAAVSAAALAGGERCMLHTDLANPTSNKIYTAIGYERVGEDVALRFDPVPSAEGKILQAFFDPSGRLLALPAKPAKRRVVLNHLAQAFEIGTRYPESEVNERLLAFGDDCASLRRQLVDAELLARAGGVYWRVGGSVET